MTDKRKAKRKESDQQVETDQLYQKIGKLEMELEWAKKNSGLSKQQKMQAIDRESEIPIVRKCEILGLSTSSLYYKPKREDDLEMLNLLDDYFTTDPSSGSRRLRDFLRNKGSRVNRKKVQRLMKVLGLEAVAPKKKTTIAGASPHLYPYLLKNLKVTRPNQVWCTDISYLRMPGGFMYIVAIMDWYSRRILSFRISNSMSTTFCLDALTEALDRYGKPEIFNSDQGSQFTRAAFRAVLLANKIKISMDGRGRWLDNVFIERF